jgi:hypothetical protein
MTKAMVKYCNWGLSVLVGIGMFLFWYVWYPHALSYQEQYQLFLWTWDYFVERVSVPGGFADWLGEFIVQFYYIEWLGALLLALFFVVFGRLAGLIPAALLLWLMGDPSVLLGYAMSIILALAAYRMNRREGKYGLIGDLLMVPVVYWMTGPMVWIYVTLRITRCGWRNWWLAVWTVTIQLFVFRFLMTQWTLDMTFLPALNYRTPMMMPPLIWIIPVVTVIVLTIQSQLSWKWLKPAMAIVALALGFVGVTIGYSKEMYELIRQDYLVRNERWDDITDRAKDYQVHTPFSSVCVNLALSQKRELADRMFDFWQSGEDALIMPRIRDLTSMLPSAETFWRLGMVNSALRYFFDTQESILNGRMSGRCTKRIAECMIVNGHYLTAKKHLNLLKKSLFYRSWAIEAEALLGNETAVNAHSVYGKLRQLRYKNDFLYSHFELYKMFGLLFMNNAKNTMALDYLMGQMLLEGQMQGFQQYLPAAERYSGYSEMPIGYQDAMRCIQMKGNVPGSPYASYVKRMMAERRKNESNDEAH